MYDLLIKNGTLVDGTGAPRFQADVAVNDGVIVKIAENIEGEAKKVIDATGLIVAPGFIDTHTHTDKVIFNPNLTGYNHLEDGTTTELAGAFVSAPASKASSSSTTFPDFAAFCSTSFACVSVIIQL